MRFTFKVAVSLVSAFVCFSEANATVLYDNTAGAAVGPGYTPLMA